MFLAIVLLALPAAAMVGFFNLPVYPLSTVVAVTVVAAILAFQVARVKPWSLLVLFSIAGLFFGLHLSELLDPFVGSAMAREGGKTYVVVSWLSPLFVVVAAVIGYVVRVRNAKSVG